MQKLKFSSTASHPRLFCSVAKSEIHICRIFIYCHGNGVVISQFHYRDKQQELMDRKKEICCLNNDYFFYLANRERGGPSSPSHSVRVRWGLEAELTPRKFTAVSRVRNKPRQLTRQDYKPRPYKAPCRRFPPRHSPATPGGRLQGLPSPCSAPGVGAPGRCRRLSWGLLTAPPTRGCARPSPRQDVGDTSVYTGLLIS